MASRGRGATGRVAPAWVQRVGFRDGARREARDARAHHHVLHGLEASRGDEGAAVSLHVARCPSTGACGDASGLSRPGLGDSAKPITPAGVGARRASEVEKAGRRRAATSRTARALPAPPPPQCDRRGAGDGRASHSSRESEPPRARRRSRLGARRSRAEAASRRARDDDVSRRAAAGGGVGGPEGGAPQGQGLAAVRAQGGGRHRSRDDIRRRVARCAPGPVAPSSEPSTPRARPPRPSPAAAARPRGDGDRGAHIPLPLRASRRPPADLAAFSSFPLALPPLNPLPSAQDSPSCVASTGASTRTPRRSSAARRRRRTASSKTRRPTRSWTRRSRASSAFSPASS